MDKRVVKNILIGAMAALAILGLLKYLASFKELQTLNQTKEQLAALKIEKEDLLQTLEKVKELQVGTLKQNALLKENLEAADRRLTKLFSDFEEAHKVKEEAGAKYSKLKSENRILREKRVELFQENEGMKEKLSSVAELKKAIKDLKRKIRQGRQALRKKSKESEESEGNRGFVVKDGKSTYPAKVKIEVIPAP